MFDTPTVVNSASMSRGFPRSTSIAATSRHDEKPTTTTMLHQIGNSCGKACQETRPRSYNPTTSRRSATSVVESFAKSHPCCLASFRSSRQIHIVQKASGMATMANGIGYRFCRASLL